MRKDLRSSSCSRCWPACAARPGYRASGRAGSAGLPGDADRHHAAAGDARRAAGPALRLPADSDAVPPRAAATERRSPRPAAFWRDLRDTTLDRLIGELARANLDVRAAAARVRGARAARTRGGARSRADGDGRRAATPGSGSRARTFPIGARQRSPTRTSGTAASTRRGSWTCSAGCGATCRRRARSSARRSEDLRDVQVSLTAELARAYFELRGAQEQLAVAQRNAENQRRTLRGDAAAARRRPRHGVRHRAGAGPAQLHAGVDSPARGAGAPTAQYQIGVLVGRPPAAVAAELEQRRGAPGAAGRGGGRQRPTRWCAGGPTSPAAERQLAAERALVGAAKADYLPRFIVGGSAGYSATTFDALGDHGTFRYAVGPSFSWPALNLGRVKARVDAAQRAARRKPRRSTRRRCCGRCRTWRRRCRATGPSRARVERIQDAAAASERAAELARLRFTGGVADFLQVLDAERTQLDAEDQLAQGHTDAATAYAALYKALGGEPAGGYRTQAALSDRSHEALGSSGVRVSPMRKPPMGPMLGHDNERRVRGFASSSSRMTPATRRSRRRRFGTRFPPAWCK